MAPSRGGIVRNYDCGFGFGGIVFVVCWQCSHQWQPEISLLPFSFQGRAVQGGHQGQPKDHKENGGLGFGTILLDRSGRLLPGCPPTMATIKAKMFPFSSLRGLAHRTSAVALSPRADAFAQRGIVRIPLIKTRLGTEERWQLVSKFWTPLGRRPTSSPSHCWLTACGLTPAN